MTQMGSEAMQGVAPKRRRGGAEAPPLASLPPPQPAQPVKRGAERRRGFAALQTLKVRRDVVV
jgi:hypothetical protein